MVDAIAPVEAGEGEGTAAPACRRQVDPKVAEEACSRGGDLELPAHWDQGATRNQGRREADAHAAGQMVVAGAGGADGPPDLRLAVSARRTRRRQDGERLQRQDRLGAGQPVVAMAPLRTDGDEPTF